MEKLDLYLETLKKKSVVVTAIREFNEYFAIACMMQEGLEEIIIHIYKEEDKGIIIENSITELKSICLDAYYEIEKGKDNEKYIGIDESGKGDYFGPLVVSGFSYSPEFRKDLVMLGIKDSKKLCDNKVIGLGNILRKKYPNNIYIMALEPERYNRIYSEYRLESKNLNHLLAWMHSEVVRHLEGENYLIDKFADEESILGRIEKTKRNNCELIYSAESMIGVACASILARSTFLSWLKEKSKVYGLNMPKGSTKSSVIAAKNVIENYDALTLKNLCKLHFKTTKKVMMNK